MYLSNPYKNLNPPNFRQFSIAFILYVFKLFFTEAVSRFLSMESENKQPAILSAVE